ncbi:TniB family NTP-binding protein [Curtobacterium luteum]|uniref:TniB family NTP-binding protein n=1 Tax=Curtobacterium luteum TaxID=33881 RepID=UPI0037F7913A
MRNVLANLDVFELHDFLRSMPGPPNQPRRADWKRLTVDERLRRNDQRLEYLNSDWLLATPRLEAILARVSTVQNRNTFRAAERFAVLIDGPSGSGKTTGLLAAGALEANTLPDGAAPTVVGVEVPAPCTAKNLLQEYLNRIRVTPPKRVTTSELMRCVVENYNRLGIRLVLVDEIQHLAYRHQQAVDAANTLKSLTNKLTATTVYAGVEIATSHLMNGAHGQQLARRSEREVTSPTTLAGGTGEWRQMIRVFEQHLTLLDHTPGTLDTHHRYLFDRTGGSIGTLRNLLVDAASRRIRAHSRALREGGAATRVTETLGLAELDAEKVNMAAELGLARSAA